MTALVNIPDGDLDRLLSHGFFEDFDYYVTADRFSTVATDSGTATVGDTAGGILAITPSDGTVANNDEIYVTMTKEAFKFAADKPLVLVARAQYAEGATDDANVAFGLMDAVAANSILDDGGGPKASYSGAVFYKVDGGTVWNVESSNAGTQTTTATDVTAGGSAYASFKIEFRPLTSTLGEIAFFIDTAGGTNFQQCKDANGNVIKHSYTITSATEMEVFFGMKNGADTTVETLNIDYVGCWQKR